MAVSRLPPGLPLFNWANSGNARSRAKAKGALTYVGEKECPRGHQSPVRYTLGGDCKLCRAMVRAGAPPKKYSHEEYIRGREKHAIRRSRYGKRVRQDKPWRELVRAARLRANKKNMEYSLSYEWAATRWTGKCEMTGIAFNIRGTRTNPHSPSIDRIDNSKGYTPENSRFVLWAINSFKGTLSDREMFEIAKELLKRKRGS